MTENFLEKIGQQLDSLNEVDFLEPNDEADPDATIVGTLDDHHRRIATLRGKHAAEAGRLISESNRARLNGNNAFADDILKQWSESNRMAQILGNILLVSLEDKYPELKGKNAVSITKGWKISYLSDEILLVRWKMRPVQPPTGPTMAAVIAGTFIMLACIAVFGAAIAMMAVGQTHTAFILGIALAALITIMFLIRQKTMSAMRPKRPQQRK